MPTITTKKPLGSLFGGQIASINYSFQSSSQPSAATITIISEDNTFQVPKFGSVISIPPFGISMKVVETKRSDSTKYKVLQVELVESISEILDKELVLVYGINTDIYADLNNDLYLDMKSFYIDRQYWGNISRNPVIKFPTFYDTHRIIGNGLNILGRARATYREDNSSSLSLDATFQTDPEWIKFDNGIINESMSNHRFLSLFSYSSGIVDRLSIEYGYSLLDLLGLLKRHGLTFDAKSEELLSDNDILFKETGTIRSVLTSCLSKIGRSFYIDPLSQRIKVVTNSDLARINNRLLKEYSDFENTSGATQISITESIKDLTASHFTVKGSLEFNAASGGSVDSTPLNHRDVLYKLNDNIISNSTTSAERGLIARVLPLLFKKVTDDTVDLYIYSLGLSGNVNKWGELYGKDQYVPLGFKKKGRGFPYNDPVERIPWQFFAQNEFPNLDVIYYTPSNTVGARQIIRDVEEKNKNGKIEIKRKMAVSASSHGYLDVLRDFGTLWSGVYFSGPMSEKETLRRIYNENASGGTSFDFHAVRGSDRIGNVPSLQFLFRLLKRIGGKTNYKVSEIADIAGVAKNLVASDEYYFIGIRKAFQGGSGEFLNEDYQEIINTNFFSLSDSSTERKWLLYTGDAANVSSKIEREALKAFAYEKGRLRDKITATYIRTVAYTDDNGGGDSQESTRDESKPFFIKNIPSKVKNFSNRGIQMIQTGYSEAKNFLLRMNEINPQFNGPLITTTISYFRPPVAADFDIEKGLDSLSVSMSESGISTTIKYSSRKFAQIDKSVAEDFLGRGTTNYPSISSAVKSYQQIALEYNKSGT